MITVNQLKTPDSTVGAHLSLRAMHETLAILSLRAPLRELETDKMKRAEDILVKLLTLNDKLEVVLILKQIRQFYRSTDTNILQTKFASISMLIFTTLLKELYSTELPWYAIKPVLKTLVMLRSSIPPNVEIRDYLLKLATQDQNREVAYWATRFIAVILTNAHTKENEQAVRILSRQIANLDISLSYRSMLADLIQIIHEKPSPDLRGVLLYCQLALLHDTNASLQRVVLETMKTSSSQILEGVQTTEEFALKSLHSCLVDARCFCEICQEVVCTFVRANMPAMLIVETEEVGLIGMLDNSCIRMIVLVLFRCLLYVHLWKLQRRGRLRNGRVSRV